MGIFLWTTGLAGQTAPTAPVQGDTLPLQIDTTDTRDGQPMQIRVSKNAITSPVRYSSVDTQWVDMRRKQIHLIGQAG
ncbi:MAG: hypothetical protein IPJ06_04735 [Saprospiraceae bacterium]|nr:hypothetical protein [Saprospiraceae bacterium]